MAYYKGDVIPLHGKDLEELLAVIRYATKIKLKIRERTAAHKKEIEGLKLLIKPLTNKALASEKRILATHVSRFRRDIERELLWSDALAQPPTEKKKAAGES